MPQCTRERRVPKCPSLEHSEYDISGRLVTAVPSAQYCASIGGCTDAQWGSALFRNTIPGAMNQVNFEQGYDLKPASLCLRDSTTCAQGDVSLYSVEAQTAGDIQAAVKFASAYNLRLAVKASGHDYLGRSTAPNSLLIRTSHFQNIAFTDAFYVGTQNLGSAVTVGSGVHLQDLYAQAKNQGKVVVGGSAATVVAAGGYLQGGGHSALAPLFGLAADNVLEFHIVVASGALLQVNKNSYPDLFYALLRRRSWKLGRHCQCDSALLAVHAQHIFDLDAVRGGQYFYLEKPGNVSVLVINTFTANTTLDEGTALLTPLVNDSLAVPGVFLIEKLIVTLSVNDALHMADDVADPNAPAIVAKIYEDLLDGGAQQYPVVKYRPTHGISSAVHPAWRTAKNHFIVVNPWDDSASAAEIAATRTKFQDSQAAIIERLSGPNAGSYSNEGDIFEPNFQTTFYGPNYAKLSAIKTRYDPKDLFIVAAGVGSERWDVHGHLHPLTERGGHSS
ncbi:FAD-binding domain-containing protein [Mycena olivaceomarginata]|nr:FAD-binding domain-containing protein [Mycena olivaceomarginata]